MSDKIATEAYAAKIGGQSSSSNRCCTKNKANSFNCFIFGSYQNNQLVKEKDLANKSITIGGSLTFFKKYTHSVSINMSFYFIDGNNNEFKFCDVRGEMPEEEYIRPVDIQIEKHTIPFASIFQVQKIRVTSNNGCHINLIAIESTELLIEKDVSGSSILPVSHSLTISPGNQLNLVGSINMNG